jgi:hypothetical protein
MAPVLVLRGPLRLKASQTPPSLGYPYVEVATCKITNLALRSHRSPHLDIIKLRGREDAGGTWLPIYRKRPQGVIIPLSAEPVSSAPRGPLNPNTSPLSSLSLPRLYHVQYVLYTYCTCIAPVLVPRGPLRQAASRTPPSLGCRHAEVAHMQDHKPCPRQPSCPLSLRSSS